MKIDNIKLLKGGGMDQNSAPEYISADDWVAAYNFREGGTQPGEEHDGTNPESTTLITQSLPAGINKGIGGGAFEDSGIVVYSRYNTAGFNQIVVYNKVTQTEQVIYEDITDSGGNVLLPLNPQNYIKFILINQTCLVGVAQGLEVIYTNLNTLTSGGYGTVLAEDLSLLKPQCMRPPTGVYGSDSGQPANYWYANLPVFITQFVNAEFNYSAWSTHSKRIVPYQQNTPTTGSDVTKNNYIIIATDIGSIRVTTINIGRQVNDETVFSIIRSVDRSYVTALPNTAINVSTGILEAYDPGTNLYYYVSYGNEVKIPIPPTETDLPYDYIWKANTLTLLNGNIIALADLFVGYPRPQIPVTLTAVGYNPNIAIPAGTYATPLIKTGQFNGASGSGAGAHRRIMSISMGRVPHTGDQIVVILADIRNATNTLNYTYPVPSAQNGNLAAVVASMTAILPASSYVLNGDGTYTITFIGNSYFGLQSYAIELFFAGASVSNSIPTFLDNTIYQAALSFRDKQGGRFFPLDTDNTFIFATPSYAQVRGNAIEVQWKINTPTAPAGAYDAQWVITKPPVNKVLDVIGTPLNYLGVWDAKTNTPTLSINSGNIGDTYQITTPSDPNDPTHYTNLGNGSSYPTGSYITNVGSNQGGAGYGQYYAVLPATFGDITTTGSILAFSLNPLNLFASQYANEGVNTILAYSFSPGDRCTLHYYIDGSGNKVFINNPCVNLSVFGYDSGTYIVKVEKSATFNASVLAGKNVFLRLYSPAQQNQAASTALNETVWREIGERITITNGLFDTTSGVLVDGGAYYKTRQYADGLLPFTNPPVQVLATDFNYSDFYASAFNSFGRPRTYNDELEQTERKAITITGQPYILGSKKNLLTRFFPEDIYGEKDGQTSSSFGAIQFLWQRGPVLVIGQEGNIFYAPVNIAYVQLNAQITQESISEKLLNNGRYETKGIGIGTWKEAFCFNEDTGYMIDPHRSEPFEITGGGVFSLSGKMSKYFKTVLGLAYSQGYKCVLFYNRYYDELMVCIETIGGILTFFPFSTTDWNPFNNYVIAPGNVSATTNGAHCTASYNGATGVVTYTPTANYVGTDTATFTFNPGSGNITLNVCLAWTAGSGSVNPFVFAAQGGVPLSSNINSNTITVTGNDYPVAISVTGGKYSINGGGFVTTAGTVSAGDIVQAQVASSGSNTTATSAVVTIDGQSSTFTVTTLAAGNYSVSAALGYGITSVVNGTATGTPVIYATTPIASGNTLAAAYATITAGTVTVAITGVGFFPGIGLNLYVNGVQVDHQVLSVAGNYTLTFPAGPVNNPTPIAIAIQP